MEERMLQLQQELTEWLARVVAYLLEVKHAIADEPTSHDEWRALNEEPE